MCLTRRKFEKQKYSKLKIIKMEQRVKKKKWINKLGREGKRKGSKRRQKQMDKRKRRKKKRKRK